MNTKPTVVSNNKSATKSKSRAPLKVVGKSAANNKADAKAYKGHRAGSRKESVHKYYDQHGREKALTYGKQQKLKESTLNQWFNTWRRGAA